ncbi:MAG: DNA methyltransferase [bacterium]
MKTENKLVWKTVTKKISDLIANANNVRTISERMKNELKKSFTKFNYVEPIVIDIDNTVISGNQRLSILVEEGKLDSEIEVRVPSRKLSKKEFNQYSLIANRVHGDFDWEKLANFDLDLILESGFDEQDLSNIFDDHLEILDDEHDLDKAIIETKSTDIKVGEIYQLGNHKLAVGDSRDENLLKRLFGDKKINCVACDINFNQDLDYKTGAGGKANYSNENPIDDCKSISEYEEDMRKSMKVIFPHLEKDSHWFWFCSQNYVWMTQKLYMELGIRLRRLCSWFKLNGNPTPNVAFNASTESCVYGTINKPYLSKKVLNLTEILNKDIGVGNRAYDDILDIIDLWIVKRINSSEQVHACQKPPSLYEKMLRRTTRPGDIVYDGFGGSGSSLIACEQLKRVCYTVELVPLFAQIIINRYEKLSGQKAVKIN